VLAVMFMYMGSRTVVRTVHSNSDNFNDGGYIQIVDMPCHGICYTQMVLIAESEEELTIKRLLQITFLLLLHNALYASAIFAVVIQYVCVSICNTHALCQFILRSISFVFLGDRL